MIKHTQLNLPKSYKNIVENLEYELYDDNSPLNIKRISNKLSEKYDWMNILS